MVNKKDTIKNKMYDILTKYKYIYTYIYVFAYLYLYMYLCIINIYVFFQTVCEFNFYDYFFIR